MQCACRGGDRVWLLPCEAEVIGCYDLASGEMRIYELKRKIVDCVDMVFADENIYILSRWGIIYICNPHELKVDEMKILETEYIGRKSMYGKMIYAGNKLIILPALTDDIKIIDVLTDNVETYHDYPGDFLYYNMEYMADWSKYAGLCEDDNYYYCAMRMENYLLKISKCDGTLSWVKPNVPSKEVWMKILTPLKERRFKNALAAGERFFLESDINIADSLRQFRKKSMLLKEQMQGK